MTERTSANHRLVLVRVPEEEAADFPGQSHMWRCFQCKMTWAKDWLGSTTKETVERIKCEGWSQTSERSGFWDGP